MATRFYFSTNDVVPTDCTTPAFDASWELTAGAPRSRMTTIVRRSAMATISQLETSTSGTFDALCRQYISDPLNAGSISGTVKGIIRAQQDNTDADMRAQLVIRVLSRDGSTVRGTLLASDNSVLSNEFDATGLVNRKFPLNWAGAGASLTLVNAQQGDRVVIEIGFRAHNTLSTNRIGTLRFGDASSTDLGENEIDSIDNNPWLEFSQDLSFEEIVTTDRGAQQSLISPLGNGAPIPQGVGSYSAHGAAPDGHENVSSERRHAAPFVFQLGGSLGNQFVGRSHLVSPSLSFVSGGEFNTLLRPTRFNPLPIATGIDPPVYLMRGQDVDCGAVTYRQWIVVGAPDFGAIMYAGIKCGLTPFADVTATRIK